MDRTDPPTGVQWPLVGGLATMNLAHPIAHLSGLSDQWGRGPTSLALALAVVVVWALLVAMSAAPRPVLTCVLAGVTTSAGLLVLGLVLSPALDDLGLTRLVLVLAMLPLTAVQVAIGAVAGVLALALQHVSRGAAARRDLSERAEP